MEAQSNTTKKQSNKKSIKVGDWRPSHGGNGEVGKKIKPLQSFLPESEESTNICLKFFQKINMEGKTFPPAVVAEWSKTLSQIQVERMP